MLQLKSLGEIASADAGWLRARHHFAIGPYGNAAHKPVGNLIVLNDDEIAPHTGFELHHHANVEIVSYIHDGTLTHRDDQGNVGTVRAGDVQVMSAGTGISHSERNEHDSPVRMFQIWLRPNLSGGAPTWGHRPFPKADRSGSILPLASGRNAKGALPIRADAEVSGAMLLAGTDTTYTFNSGAAGYLVPVTGAVEVNTVLVQAREGLVIKNETVILIRAIQDSELVLVVTAC
ncbi:MAG TPA: pirin family protein [Terriglobia bacterium]|nr:pirin family protein [Terriglobia bacterium]